MRTASLAINVLTALLLAAGSASSAACADTPTDSGITGLVTIGPTSPVQQEGQTGEAPYSATIVIRDSGGTKVTAVTSGIDGRFVVHLAPGTYILEPQSPGILPYAEPQRVTVEAHRFTEVTVAYDSGIR